MFIQVLVLWGGGVVPQYLTPLSFSCGLVGGAASRVDRGLELLQNRAPLLLL